MVAEGSSVPLFKLMLKHFVVFNLILFVRESDTKELLPGRRIRYAIVSSFAPHRSRCFTKVAGYFNDTASLLRRLPGVLWTLSNSKAPDEPQSKVMRDSGLFHSRFNCEWVSAQVFLQVQRDH